jgi:CheY-specific phosphatase CheX
MADAQFNFPDLIDKLSNRMVAFLNTELDIATIDSVLVSNTLQKMQLNYLTSLISLEGSVKMFVALSYDESLFNEVFARYTAELTLEDDEQEEAMIDSAGDIVNILVGNTLADINDNNKKITMSPPIVITAAKQIGCQRHSLVYRTHLITQYGVVDVYLIDCLIQDGS